MTDARASTSERLDVAIVGAGISGLYAAWRLGEAEPERKVALFECSQRIGGRIDTVPAGDSNAGCRVEFGAMRFLGNQKMIQCLLKKLSLATEVFPGMTMRQYFVRGVQVVNPNGSFNPLPYHLGPGEPANPIELVEYLLNKVVNGAFDIQPNDWEAAIRDATFKGRPLYEWGFWNVIEAVASNEAYAVMDDGFGNQSALSNINAAMAIRLLSLPLADFLRNEVYRPKEGLTSIVDALEQAIVKQGVCPINRGYRLTALLPAADDGVQLIFESGGESPIAIEADRVVLAMPQRALNLLGINSLIPQDEWRSKLSCVTGVPAFRLCLAYAEPWWKEMKGWMDGYAYTDLPVRQVYYGLGVGGTADENARVMMATYCDDHSTEFWTGLARLSPHKSRGLLRSQYKAADAGELIASVNSQLKTLLNLTEDPPKPLWAGYIDWSGDPFGGSWHEWVPGCDVLTEIPAMLHPFPDVPVYICGEAYSWYHGWIEGALMSAERLLQDHFDLHPPSDWLDPDYSLGP